MLNRIDKIIYLKKVPIFQNLTGEELLFLSDITTEENFSENEIIFEKNTSSDKLYIIIKGIVEIYIEHKGKKQIISKLKEFDYFGEMSLFDDSLHSATAISVSKTTCLVIPREGFLDVLTEYPSIAIELLKTLSKRIRDTTGRIL